MSQEVAIALVAEAGEEEGRGEREEDTVGVLNVAVPLAFSVRHGDAVNSTMEQSPDSHVTETTPHSSGIGLLPLPVQPDQPVLIESPSRESEAADEGEGREAENGSGGDIQAPVPIPVLASSSQANTVQAPIFQVMVVVSGDTHTHTLTCTSTHTHAIDASSHGPAP